MGEHDRGDDQHQRDAEEAVRAQVARAQQCDDPGQEQRQPDQQARAEQPDEREPGAAGPLGPDDGTHPRVGPVVPRLPPERGRDGDDGEGGAGPQGGPGEQPPRTAREGADGDRDPQRGHEELGEQRQRGHRAGEEQQPVGASAHPADQQVQDHRPPQRVERVRREPVPDGAHQRHRDRRRGEGLRPGAPAQLAGEEAGQQGVGHDGERRGQPQHDEVPVRQVIESGGEQRHQRRLVEVAGSGVLPPRDDEVRLVEEVAVVAAAEQHHDEHGGADEGEVPPRDGRRRCPAHIRGPGGW
ncbi:hypothetical protein MTP03_27920 [Tsukamurella sp. PLM1]|nr:hypothetical protein MTP03_27920 [Tsukamurella sp. PLM1]